ncbi:uncharacterized protein LY89DRAFT_727384 [Mollisia scopiformis]|uniref:Uncharacterized protein n=1 Tax=Mollisia scopiformis TaxID=149040 RepID=A0A194XX40_MOLSC|nr:uncharacterized protein LY89DRAFT_727384 [Mollisia scopiformis]KUJ24352.1 hypothetical protein LY89DRAFT_727384 [Mollisia scopiformis]
MEHLQVRFRAAFQVTPEAGYRRLEWKCDCGENLYGDFPAGNENELRAVEQLEKELKLNCKIIWGKRPLSTFERDIIALAGGAPVLQSQHSSGSIKTKGQSTSYPMTNLRNHQAQNIREEARSPIRLRRLAEERGQLGNRSWRYLELCFNSGKHQIQHAELDVTHHTTTDHTFFQKIKTEYFRMSKRRWFFEPKDVRFVEFSVQNMGELAGIINGFDERNPALPPEELVRQGTTWEYKPRPRGPPVPSNIILHELTSKKSKLHTSTTWSRRMPKKLNTSIYAIPDPNEAAFGWGIHIFEGYNVFLITILISVLALLGSAGCILATALWWTLRDDLNGALALGAALAALLAVLLGWAVSFLQGVNRS